MTALVSEYVDIPTLLKTQQSKSRNQFWKNPGAIARSGLEPNHIGWDRFLAILSVFVQAAFSYQGMELVVM